MDPNALQHVRKVLVCADWFNLVLLQREFGGRDWEVVTTEDEKEAFAALGVGHYDLMVIEARPPFHDAVTTLKHIRADLHVLDLPILVLTDGVDRDLEAKLKWYAPVGSLHMPFIGPDFDWSASYDERKVAARPQGQPEPASGTQAA